MRLPTFVNATDLHEWANRRESQSTLPRLIRRLILATVDGVERLSFAADEGVQGGGWDGILRAVNGNAFVPHGTSVWETGANKGVKAKADADYEKRTADPGTVVPADTTFVFVTPRRWNAKDQWVAEKQAEGVWQDVRAYDADDLDTWLESTPAVHLWLSDLLGKHPEGVTALSTFWEDWSHATHPAFTPALVIGGRTAAAEQVLSWLGAAASQLTVQGETAQDALAFFAGAVHDLPETQQVACLARTIIVESEAAWPWLAATQRPLILMPLFSAGGAIVKAVDQGHHVFVPIGKADTPPPRAVVLPRADREGVQQVLTGLGVPERRAAEFAQLARRNPTAFRRRLAVVPELRGPLWVENKREKLSHFQAWETEPPFPNRGAPRLPLRAAEGTACACFGGMDGRKAALTTRSLPAGGGCTYRTLAQYHRPGRRASRTVGAAV